MSAASILTGDATAATTTAAAATTTTTAATTTEAAGVASSLSTVATAQQQADTKTWVDQIEDTTIKSFVVNKGWKSPGDVAHGYFHLEKLLGGEKIPMPKGDTDAEGWNRVYKAIGRPETPEGYKLPAPANGERGFIDAAAKVFHDNGLSGKQASALAKWYSDFSGTITQAQQQAAERRNATELETFKKEQGSMFDAQLELGRRAAKQFGFTNDELVAFESAHGTRALLTRFAAIGQALGEHVVTGKGAEGFGLNATQASARLEELKRDKEFTAKYLAGDAQARQQMMALQAASAGMTLEEYQASIGPIGARR